MIVDPINSSHTTALATLNTLGSFVAAAFTVANDDWRARRDSFDGAGACAPGKFVFDADGNHCSGVNWMPGSQSGVVNNIGGGTGVRRSSRPDLPRRGRHHSA